MPVFISYRHTDRDHAFKIDQRLKVAGIKTYLDVLDEESRQGADEITDIITKESANKRVISSQAGSLIKISRIRADCSPVNTSN